MTKSKMAQDWDRRAEENAFYWIAYSADEKAFMASAKANIKEIILNDIILDTTQSVTLEIGCGIGRLLREMSHHCKFAYGVDISPKMIEMSKHYLSGLSNAETILNQGDDLDGILDSSIDFCYSFIVFQHIPSKEVINSYIEATFRKLRPGGMFKFQVDGGVNPGRDANSGDTWVGVCFSEEEIVRICMNAGYSILYVTGASTQYMWVLVGKPACAVRVIAKSIHPTIS